MLKLFEAKLEGPKREAFKRAQVAGLGLGAANFFLYASWGLDYWYGAKLAGQGEVSFSDMLKVFFVLVSTGRVLADAGALAPDLAKGSQAIASVFSILDRTTQIDSENKNAQMVDKVEGHIELQSVGADIVKLAVQFCVAHPGIATTLVGSANPENIRKNIAYAEEPIDFELMAKVLELLEPIHNHNFTRGRPENRDPIVS